VIPSCVVKKIRGKFPAPDGIYTGFLYGEVVDENAFSWIYKVQEEEDA